MRGSLKALPIIESVHVMAVALVFGTIILVDLRLLGIRDTDRPFTRVFRELVRWTWLGFAVAATTGVLLFIPNAQTYVVNTAFKLKLAALACAGINMAVFEFTTLRSVAKWDTQVPVPFAAKMAGVTSVIHLDQRHRVRALDRLHQGYHYTGPGDVDSAFLRDGSGSWGDSPFGSFPLGSSA